MNQESASQVHIQAISPGDLLIAATDVEEATLDFRKGIRGRCRILHCDGAFRVIQEIYTGEDGLLVGLAIDPIDRLVYATNPQGYTVRCFGMDGRPRPGPDFLPHRRFGNLVFRSDGTALIGVHSFHGDPIEDEYGDGKLFGFDPRARTFSAHVVDIDGGRGGKHCISNLALSPDETTLFYVSEAGRRVLQFDLANGCQKPDVMAFPAEDPRGTYGIQALSNGGLLMAVGIGAAVFSPTGALLKTYDVPERKGWTRAKLARDGLHFYLGNFLDGLLQKRRLDTGDVVQELDVGRKGSLTSVVEVP